LHKNLIQNIERGLLKYLNKNAFLH
jgi:hypothetical protein